MSDETVICANCRAQVPKSEVLCPECGMGLEPLDESKILDFDDLDSEDDSSLDDLLGESDSEDINLDDFLTVNEPTTADSLDFETTEEESDDDIKEFLGLDSTPAIPSFDDSEQAPEIPSFDDEFTPAMPSFDDFGGDQVTEEIEEEVVDTESKVSMKTIFVTHFTQFVYWIAIFFIISLASIELLDPNIDLTQIQSTMIVQTTDYKNQPKIDYGSIQVYPEIFIFGWIAFVGIGFFARYRLEQLGKSGSIIHATLFLLTYTFVFGIISYILYNAGLGIVLSMYFGFMWLGYFIALITGGFVMYIIGYFLAFERLYSYSPISKIKSV